MFSSQKDQNTKKNTEKAVVGYDLGMQYAQISYCALEEGEPETVSAVAGTEQYNIPTVLCKRSGVGQWYYGKEAVKFAREENGILVENLLLLAERGEDVIVEEEAFDPVALLTLFVKRSLSFLGMRISLDQIEAFMFTVENLTPRMVDILGMVVAGLKLKTGSIYFQSHRESFYYYTIHQDKSLWNNDVMIFEFNDNLKNYSMECNTRTIPQVVFIEETDFPQIKRALWDEDERIRQSQKEELDEAFHQAAVQCLEERIVSTVFLLGDGFKEEWAKESLKLLCRGRRVFQGNNLYSKGACYGVLERIAPSEEGKTHVYLGEDKLKSNIGMRVLRRGEDSYYAILDAGMNWYEASSDFEVILESGNTIDMIVTSLTGGVVTDKRIDLEGLPVRPRSATRLRLHIEMTAVDQAAVTIEDLGFGELFSSSGKAWTQTIPV